MNDISVLLKDLGLHETEALIYIAIAKNPNCKTSDIQRETELVRTTIYHSLASLKADGYISESAQNNVRTYTVNDVQNFRSSVEEKIRQEQEKLHKVDSLEPLLNSLVQNPSGDSSVSHYEGIEAVKKAIELALRAESKHWHIIAARENFLFNMPKSYQQYYLSERERRGIFAKTLWEPTDDCSPLSLKTLATRKPRYLPKSFKGTFNSLVIIYDDTTLIIDSYDQKTANAVHSQTTANLLRLMFDALWDSAEKIS